jgi:hypothetical protein
MIVDIDDLDEKSLRLTVLSPPYGPSYLTIPTLWLRLGGVNVVVGKRRALVTLRF